MRAGSSCRFSHLAQLGLCRRRTLQSVGRTASFFSVAAVLTCQDRRHSERVPISPRWQQLGLGLAALPLGAKHFQVVAPLVEHLPLLAPLEGHLLSAVSCRAELQSLYVAQQAPQVANATAAHP